MKNINRISDEQLDIIAQGIHIKPQYHGIDPTDYSFRTSSWDAITAAYNEYKESEQW